MSTNHGRSLLQEKGHGVSVSTARCLSHVLNCFIQLSKNMKEENLSFSHHIGTEFIILLSGFLRNLTSFPHPNYPCFRCSANFGTKSFLSSLHICTQTVALLPISKKFLLTLHICTQKPYLMSSIQKRLDFLFSHHICTQVTVLLHDF